MHQMLKHAVTGNVWNKCSIYQKFKKKGLAELQFQCCFLFHEFNLCLLHTNVFKVNHKTRSYNYINHYWHLIPDCCHSHKHIWEEVSNLPLLCHVWSRQVHCYHFHMSMIWYHIFISLVWWGCGLNVQPPAFIAETLALSRWFNHPML